MIKQRDFNVIVAPLGWTKGQRRDIWRMEKRLMQQVPLTEEQERALLQRVVIETLNLRKEVGF